MDNDKNLVLFDTLKSEVPYSNNFSITIFDKYTLRQKKLLLILIAGIQNKNKNLYKFNPKDIKKMINMERQSYKEFAELILDIQKKPILIYNKEKNRLDSVSLFSMVSFYIDDEYISVNFSENAKELFLGLKGNFSKYFIENIRNLSSEKSIELYLRSESFLYKKEFSLSLEDINIFLQKEPSKNLKRVLVSAVNDINDNTDILLDFEKIVSGKKIIGYKFFPKRSSNFSNELLKAIEKAKKNIYISKAITFDPKVIQSLLREFSEKDLIIGLNYCYSKINKSFKTLSYLKKIINSAISETIEQSQPKKIEKESSKDENLDSNIKDVNLDSNINPISTNSILFSNKKSEIIELWKHTNNPVKEEIEDKALRLLEKEEQTNIEFLKKMKNNSLAIYINTISKYIIHIIENEYNFLLKNNSSTLNSQILEEPKRKKRGKGRPKKLDMLDQLDFEEEVTKNIRSIMTFLRKKIGKEEIKKLFSNFSEKEKINFLIENYVDFLKSKEK